MIDEVAGMLVALSFVPHEDYRLLRCFFLFRLFDIWKPWPISWADQNIKGGLGILLDDLIAGLFAGGIILCTFSLTLNQLNSCKFVSESELPTKFGEFTISAFEEPNGKDHIALTIGDIQKQDAVMCRVHSECLTGDALHSLRCDCGPQLQAALQMLAQNKSGILLVFETRGQRHWVGE